MKSISCLTAALFCAACVPVAAQPVAPAGSPAPGAAPAPATSAGDKAYELVGTWTCRSAADSVGTWTIARQADGSLTLVNHFVTARGAHGEWDETYRFDPATSTWTWNSAFEPGETYEEGGTAADWTGNSWVYTGKIVRIPTASAAAAGRVVTAPLRMMYSGLGPNSLKREFDVYANGQWTPQSSSTCTRGTA